MQSVLFSLILSRCNMYGGRLAFFLPELFPFTIIVTLIFFINFAIILGVTVVILERLY